MCLTCTVHQMHKYRMRLSEFLSVTQIKPAVFARQIGVSHTTVARWASGDVAPTLEAMEKIAAATAGRVMPNDFMRTRPVLHEASPTPATEVAA